MAKSRPAVQVGLGWRSFGTTSLMWEYEALSRLIFGLGTDFEDAAARRPGPTPAIATELRYVRVRCVPAGKWMPVPCRSCRVTPISCSSGWF